MAYRFANRLPVDERVRCVCLNMERPCLQTNISVNQSTQPIASQTLLTNKIVDDLIVDQSGCLSSFFFFFNREHKCGQFPSHYFFFFNCDVVLLLFYNKQLHGVETGYGTRVWRYWILCANNRKNKQEICHQ